MGTGYPLLEARTSSPTLQGPGPLAYVFHAIDGAPGVGAACTRLALRGLAGIHWLLLAARLATYRSGLAGVTRLPIEVISVGNLSLGGTGKTLAVRRLARELAAVGRRVAILSRGHGRQSREERVVCYHADRGLPRPCEVGDEPSLLAACLPEIPVIVGKDRRSTGRKAVAEFGADVLILDDGFQYWRLHRDREIVLLDALQPPARELLFPRGTFREPWSHLRRAHEVWITHARLAPPARVAFLAEQAVRHAPHARVRCTEHHPLHLCSLQGETAPLEMLHEHRLLALSGLGNPRQFELMLESLNLDVSPCRYPDHHRYTPADIDTIARRLEPGMLCVTTAKDAVRLPKHPPFPVWVVEVEMVDVPGIV
ncbi:MAG: tetraacyldisaccharide 4'-kinase [Armatimonadota bacterium]